MIIWHKSEALDVWAHQEPQTQRHSSSCNTQATSYALSTYTHSRPLSGNEAMHVKHMPCTNSVHDLIFAGYSIMVRSSMLAKQCSSAVNK